MVLFGPFGSHTDLHTAQHQGPLRGEAWCGFYIFARSWGRRSCQETDPRSIVLQDSLSGPKVLPKEGTSWVYSQALTPGVASFLPGEGSTFCGLYIRCRYDSQLPPPLHAAETRTNYITGRIHANRGKHIGNFTMATAGACAS